MKNKLSINNVLLNLIFVIFFCLVGFSQTEGTITIESSSKIKSIIAKKIEYNKTNPKINGYRIQLFNGSETGAIKVLGKFNALFPDTPTSIDWVTPEWRVRVGKYKTRLEADKVYEEIKLTFGSAMIIKMKIRI